uniref:hypothetical protein n=1 Tax=Gelidibacter sp. TaxID=2018083 RepID=UPI0040493FCE
MESIEFENLLGEHLSVVEEKIGFDFQKNHDNKFYINREFLDNYFYEMPYNFITISTNENDIVQSVTIHFNEIISRPSYNLLIKSYGKPSNIQVIENRQIISESNYEEDNFKQHLTKRTFDLREGTFEENPLYIIWKKETYQIKAFLRQNQNMSEITFSITKDN